VRAYLRKLWFHTRALWVRAKSERASPAQIGWAFGIGVFAGCTPALLVHGWVALGLATLFRLNRLFAWIGSRVSNFMVLPWIVLAEIQVAHRLRTGAFLALTKEDALAQGPALLVDWCIGTLPVGGALAIFFGLLAYVVSAIRARRRAAAPTERTEATPHTRDELRPPSSGSRP
jgi:uncharacterized protein (DUF2062 family)